MTLAARNILHREVTASAVRCLKHIGIEYTGDVGMSNAGKKNCLAEHFVNLIETHADALENFHRLPAEKTVFNVIDGKCSLAREAFNSVGETLIIPANVGAYIVRPLDAKNERQLATLKTFVRASHSDR